MQSETVVNSTQDREGRRAGSPYVTPSHFRRDIEGLRAVAVALVLLYHAGLDQFRAGYVGVDVFFVISGFLITGLVLREREREGAVSLRLFYARRIRRLLPAAATLVLTTVAFTFAFLPSTRWSTVGLDVMASSAYAQNWRLADRAVDYLAQDAAAGPLQHFWSLAVEEQFYLAWPMLIALLCLRTDHMPRRRLAIGMIVLAGASLATSMYLSYRSPSTAYFVTYTRVWEFALGGMLGLTANKTRRLRPLGAVVLSWAGLIAIIGTACFLPSTAPFPGAVALIPTLGTVAMIAATPAAGSRGPGRLLETSPMQWGGALSYSIYLWHWPVLVIAEAQLGALSTWQGVAAVVLSLLPALTAYRFVEGPLRRAAVFERKPDRAFQLALACTILGCGAGLLLFSLAPDATPRVDPEVEEALQAIEALDVLPLDPTLEPR